MRPATLLKKRLWPRCFPVNFGKFLRTYFLQTTFGELLLRFLRNLFSFLTRSPLRGCFCILKKNCYAEIVAPVAAKYSNRKNDEFHRFIKQIAITLALKEFCCRSQMLFKINVLSNFANFTGKHLCCSLFLIKLQAWGLRPY